MLAITPTAYDLYDLACASHGTTASAWECLSEGLYREAMQFPVGSGQRRKRLDRAADAAARAVDADRRVAAVDKTQCIDVTIVPAIAEVW